MSEMTDLPRARREVETIDQIPALDALPRDVRCICEVETLPAPKAVALAVYSGGLISAALAGYALGRLARIRRKVRVEGGRP